MKDVVSVASKNNKQTGAKAASQAAKVLSAPGSTKAEKSAAGSALSQVPNSKGQTSPKSASKAGKVLGSPASTKAEKTAAASALAQTPKGGKKK